METPFTVAEFCERASIAGRQKKAAEMKYGRVRKYHCQWVEELSGKIDFPEGRRHLEMLRNRAQPAREAKTEKSNIKINEI